MQLRDFQQKVETEVEQAWSAGHTNVLAVLPTGGGKTALFSSIVAKTGGVRAVTAHRSELVSQIALSLAKWGVAHNIVASQSTQRDCVAAQQSELGRSFYSPSSKVIVSSVDTLLRKNYNWFPHVTLHVTDEGHHVLEGNKWGKACALFPNARNLGVTATPCRADGRGLGAHADGIFSAMVEGPTGRELMDAGWLSEYDVYCFKPGDLNLASVDTGSTGDYKMPQLRKATHASSQLVGDVVQTYLKYGKGKRGITFAVDIEQARELNSAYLAAGVASDIVTGNTPAAQRASTLKAYRDGRIVQLVNVDLFGEGFDVPMVEVVSMARATASFALFCQQIGRALRPVYAEGFDLLTDAGRRMAIAAGPKPRGIILDHVGNYVQHAVMMGLPEGKLPWSLDARERRSKGASDDGVPLTSCEECGRPYERFYRACPHCGHAPKPAERGKPEQVDGDLELLDKAALSEMLREAGRCMDSVQVPRHLLGTPAEKAIINRHHARFAAQLDMRDAIAAWGGWAKADGLADHEAQRKFFHTFKVDVLSAQAYGAADAAALASKVKEVILKERTET